MGAGSQPQPPGPLPCRRKLKKSCPDGPRGATDKQPSAGLPAPGSTGRLPERSVRLLHETDPVTWRITGKPDHLRGPLQHPIRRRVRGGITPHFPFHRWLNPSPRHRGRGRIANLGGVSSRPAPVLDRGPRSGVLFKDCAAGNCARHSGLVADRDISLAQTRRADRTIFAECVHGDIEVGKTGVV